MDFGEVQRPGPGPAMCAILLSHTMSDKSLCKCPGVESPRKKDQLLNCFSAIWPRHGSRPLPLPQAEPRTNDMPHEMPFLPFLSDLCRRMKSGRGLDKYQMGEGRDTLFLSPHVRGVSRKEPSSNSLFGCVSGLRPDECPSVTQRPSHVS